MSLLDFNEPSPKSSGSRKPLKLVLGIGALVGTIALGSTLAASINLNGGGPVEFGQGVTQTTACDDEITLTPYSTFINADGAGSYKFSSLKVSGIDSSSDKCSGKTFVIKAYGDSGILNLVSYADTANPEDDGSYNYVEIANDGGEFTWVSGGSDGDDVIPGPDGYITETSFTLNFTSDLGTITRTPLASAEEVKRITIESKDGTASGSLSFSNSSIVYDANDAFKIGTNDFTIETWAYVSSSISSTDGAVFYDTGSEVNNLGGFAFWIEANELKYRINGCWCNSTGYDIEVPMIWYDGWHHYAVSRTEGRVRLFVDGILVASSYDSVDQSSTSVNTLDLNRTTPSIGTLDGYGNRFALAGKMESLRVIIGSAEYVSNFTPPNQLANEVGTVLLLKPTNSDNAFVDHSNFGWVPSVNSVLPTWSAEHR
jgi:hypothetical protein